MLGDAAQNPRSYISVKSRGEGSAVALDVYFYDGTGGVGVIISPSWAKSQLPVDLLQRYGAAPREYSELAKRPVNLSAEQSKRWQEARDLQELLELLATTTQVELICDDYDYGCNWSSASAATVGRRQPGRAPAGEPLGFWLDLICQGTYIPGASKRILSLQWREVNGCILLRNQNWWGDDADRVPPSTRAWLRQLQRSGNPHILNLTEANRLLSQLDNAQLKALSLRGLLPADSRLSVLRPYLPLVSVVDAARAKRLFSPTGLAISELSPEQRAAVCTSGPGLHPLKSGWQHGDPIRFSFSLADGRFTIRTMSPDQPPYECDLRLPTTNPEVCRVSVQE